MKYRPLKQDELVQVGDIGCTAADKIEKCGAAARAGESHVIGRPASKWGPLDFWYRPVTHNWISFEDRKPTQEDATRSGTILVMYSDNHMGISAWACQHPDATHWIACNFIADEPAPIKVDRHEVIPNKDGSVKVGCQTITKEEMDEIIRQRVEVMK